MRRQLPVGRVIMGADIAESPVTVLNARLRPAALRWPGFQPYSLLIERKQRLRAILPKERQRLLYCDHIDGAGEKLFALASTRDLEGIVAKHKFGPYLQDAAKWFKIRNRKYSQWEGREKFFEREREVDPDMTVWDSCVLACDGAT